MRATSELLQEREQSKANISFAHGQYNVNSSRCDKDANENNDLFNKEEVNTCTAMNEQYDTNASAEHARLKAIFHYWH